MKSRRHPPVAQGNSFLALTATTFPLWRNGFEFGSKCPKSPVSPGLPQTARTISASARGAGAGFCRPQAAEKSKASASRDENNKARLLFFIGSPPVFMVADLF
jgi:hypothetical protein